ncbi:MAG: glycosyltransferase [Bacteroidales bacterium]|nr:glycosyltransferase [Bacteroidales bacterium]
MKSTNTSNLHPIHALWIGTHLSPIELLCIHSFLEHGHEFHLWVYEKIQTPLPNTVILENASMIIPKEEVFCYQNTNQYGHGKGSYAGFSDIFRYKLLYEYGGWWTDMDVICLKPLNFADEYVFRTHHDFPVVGNIMKCPKGSPLMLDCYQEAKLSVTSENKDWNKPIEILNRNIEKNQLGKYIKEISNPDSWLVVARFLLRNEKINSKWYVLHLLNEEWRRNKIDKNGLCKNTTIGKFMIQYKIKTSFTLWKCCKNKIRIIFPIHLIMKN